MSTNLDFTNLHHAYALSGSLRDVQALREKVAHAGDFEITIDTFETFGIDDARELVRKAQLKSVRSGKVFLLHTTAITPEAQNALLKLFEEPPENSHLFLCVPAVEDLLPTLRSRTEVLTLPQEHREGGIDMAVFMRASRASRIALLEELIKEKDKAGALEFLNSLEEHLAQNTTQTDTRTLAHIYAVRRALLGKGASLKILLESVALTV